MEGRKGEIPKMWRAPNSGLSITYLHTYLYPILILLDYGHLPTYVTYLPTYVPTSHTCPPTWTLNSSYWTTFWSLTYLPTYLCHVPTHVPTQSVTYVTYTSVLLGGRVGAQILERIKTQIPWLLSIIALFLASLFSFFYACCIRPRFFLALKKGIHLIRGSIFPSPLPQPPSLVTCVLRFSIARI